MTSDNVILLTFPVQLVLDSCDSDRSHATGSVKRYPYGPWGHGEFFCRMIFPDLGLRQTDMSEREEEVKQKANDSRKAEERILGLMKASFFLKPFIIFEFCYAARCAVDLCK